MEINKNDQFFQPDQGQTVSSVVQPTENPSVNAPESGSFPPQENVALNSSTSESVQPAVPGKKKSKLKKCLILALVLLVVGGAAFLALKFLPSFLGYKTDPAYSRPLFLGGVIPARNGGIDFYSQAKVYGFKDKSGEWVIRPKYLYCNDLLLTGTLSFDNIDLFPVMKETFEWVYVNSSGETVIKLPSGLSFPDLFSEGLASVAKGHKYGYIDKSGEFVVNPVYDYAHPFQEGRAVVQVGEKYCMIDKNGKRITEASYEVLRSVSEGLAAAEKNGKWGFLDKNGKVVIDFIYDDAGVFLNGLAAVKKNGKWGYINKNGETIIDFQYKQAGSFSEGLAPVSFGTKKGYIDKEGKLVIPLEFDGAGEFVNGLAPVKLNGKWGYINRSGKTVIDPQFDSASNFYNDGFAKVWVPEKKIDENFETVDSSSSCVINRDGKIVAYLN